MAKIKWARLIPHRQTWAFVVGKFMIDPIWWFYLFWVPDFLQRKHGVALMKIGMPIIVIYVIADVGSVAGGWFSSWLINRGRASIWRARAAMFICALCVVPIVFAYRVESMWGAVLLIGLAAAAHQGFSANLFTLTSDTFPAQAVGSVVGNGRDGRRGWRNADREDRRLHTPMDWQLHGSIPDCRLCLPAGARCNSNSGPTPRACEN